MVALFVIAAALAAQVAPAESPPPALTIQDAITRAQRDSPARGALVAVADGAAEAVRVAGRPLNPLLDIRSENWTPSSSTQLPLDLWATITQPVELGGKRGLRTGLARADRDAAAADVTSFDRQLASQTAQLYMQALRARGVLASLDANRDGLATIVDAMRARVGEGHVAESDLLRFEAEAARLDIDIARATLDLDRSLASLAVLIGVPTIAASQLVLPALPPVPSPAEPVAIAAAVSRHPDMTAAAARLHRAEQVLAIENARRIPDPAFTTGYKRTVGITTMVAAVTATVPLFDRNNSSRVVAGAAVKAAAAEQDATRARLSSEIALLARTAATLRDRAARTERELLEPAGVVREAARASFREGTVDVLKLIDAERVYAEVGRVALDLQLEAIASAIDARIALGEAPLP
jgi:cobalt-zinc-cadmium efflux system outer membrane protein